MDAELVGRQRQLSDVAAALADAASGRPRVVSIEGDGGAGKTALARRSLADLAVEHRTVVLAGDELTAVVPFATLGPLVDVPFETTVVEAARLVIGRLAELADAGLLVVLVDDLHWADLASRQALAIAAGRLEHEAVAIVVTARPEHSGVDDGWARLRNDARRCVRVRVGELTVADVAALAAQRGVQLTSTAARRLTEHAGGNALYVRTLLDDVPPAVLNRPGETLPVPADLSAVVAAKFAGVDTGPAALLAALAVLARPAPLPQVAEVADIADPAAAVGGVLATRWVEWRAGGAGLAQLGFAHPLFRQAVYDHLPPADRRRLHLAAARVSDRRGELTHRVATADRVDEALAAELEAEARSASGRDCVGVAAQLLRWAAELTPERAARERRLLAAARLVVDADGPTLSELIPAVAACADSPARDLVLGEAAWQAGDSGETTYLLQRAATADDDAVAVEALVRLADVFVVLGHGQAAIDVADDALARVPSDERVRLRAWASRAFGVASRDGAVAGLTWLRGRLPARPDECAPAEIELLAIRGMLGWFALRPTAALDDLAVVLARPATTLQRRQRAQLDVAQCQFVIGRWDEATVNARLTWSCPTASASATRGSLTRCWPASPRRGATGTQRPSTSMRRGSSPRRSAPGSSPWPPAWPPSPWPRPVERTPRWRRSSRRSMPRDHRCCRRCRCITPAQPRTSTPASSISPAGSPTNSPPTPSVADSTWPRRWPTCADGSLPDEGSRQRPNSTSPTRLTRSPPTRPSSLLPASTWPAAGCGARRGGVTMRSSRSERHARSTRGSAPVPTSSASMPS